MPNEREYHKVFVDFKSCYVLIQEGNRTPYNYIETKFDDGTFVPAKPNYNEMALTTAKDLGYEENNQGIELMTVHHELLHTILCEKCGLPYSPTLWSVAHQQKPEFGAIDVWRQYEEEALVLSYQKYMHTCIIEPPLEFYISQSGLKLPKLKKEINEIFNEILFL